MYFEKFIGVWCLCRMQRVWGSEADTDGEVIELILLLVLLCQRLQCLGCRVLVSLCLQSWLTFGQIVCILDKDYYVQF